VAEFKAIVYDLDGTLVDTFRDIAEAANCGMAACGRTPLSVETWKELVGYGIRNLFRWALSGGRDEQGNCLGPEPTDAEIDRAIETTGDYYDQNPVVHSKPYPGVAEVLQEFSEQAIKQAVLSNKMHEVVLENMAQLGLSQWMDIMLGDTPRFPTKPDPRSLLYLLSEMDVTSDEALMVGDAETDLQVARSAGIKVCLLTYGSRSREQLAPQEPDWLIDEFASLRGIVYGHAPCQRAPEALR